MLKLYSENTIVADVLGPDDLKPLLKRMKDLGFLSEYVNDKVELMQFLE